jgi:hypothetical protein
MSIWRLTVAFAKAVRLQPAKAGCVQQRTSMMRPTKLLLCLVILGTPLSLSPGQIEPERDTGIEGVITISPTRPGPIRAGSDIPNAAPLLNAVFSVQNEKGKATSFTTDNEGRFRVSLKPGHYVVTLAEQRFPRPCGPFEIDVESAKMTKVEWRCDTGMR